MSTWSRDPVGNQLGRRRRRTATDCGRDKLDQLTNTGGAACTFHANGNQTGRGGRTFAYDQANRLLSTTLVTTTTSFAYDGDSNRLRKSYCDCDPVTATLDVNQPLPVLLGDGERKYVWGVR